MTLGAARYWDGTRWTSNVTFGGQQFPDPTPLEVVRARSDAADAEIVRLYVQDAVHRGLIGEVPGNAMLRDLERTVHPTPPPPPRPAPAARPAQQRPATPAPAPRSYPTAPPVRTPVPARAPVPVQPGVVALWWQRVRHAVVSDLAVHGLAYLGVVLLFSGVFGLIAFSSGDMRPEWRGVADLLAPTAFFCSAWYLRRRRASAVAAALTLLGGAILPIVAIACVTDGSSVPPDVSGTALPITQGLLCAAIAGWMVWAVGRWPQSTLRFVAMPTLWLGAGVAAGLVRDPIPTGEATARPAAAQIAAILAALCVTVVVLRLTRRHGPVATSALASAAYVAAALFALELLIAANHEWPVVSGVITAASMLVLLEALAGGTRRPPAEVVTIGQAAALVTGALRLLPEVRADWTGAVLAVLLLGLAEYAGRRRPTDAATGVVLAAALAAGAVAATDPAAGLAAAGCGAAWALWRHWRPASWMPTTDDPYGVLPAALVGAATVEFWQLVDTTTTMLTLAGVGIALALLPRAVSAWRQDRLLRAWPLAMTAAALTISINIPWDEGRERVLIVAACATLTVALSSVHVILRTWLSGVLTVWTLANAAVVLDVATPAQTITLAVLGAAAVLVGLFVRGPVALHVAYLGHVVGVAAISVPHPHGWTSTVTIGCATVAWAATAVVHEWRGAPTITTIATLFRTADGPATWVDQLPVLATTAGLCATSTIAVDASNAVPLDSLWAATAISGVAVVAALAARFVPWHRAAPLVLHTVAVVLSLGAVAATELIREPAGSEWPTWPTIVGIACGLAVVVVATAPRPLVTVWLGWVETAALAVLLAGRAGLPVRWADLALGTWGAVTCLGALLVDRLRNGSAKPSAGMRTPALWPPLTLGVISLLVGVPVGYIGESAQFAGWLSLAAAAVVFAAALIRPLAYLSLPGWGLLTASLALLPHWHPYEHPWVLVPGAGALMGVAWLTRVTHDHDWRTRWDIPAFVAGHVVLAWALIATGTYGSVAVTCLSAAVLTFAVAAVVPHSGWAAAGLVLTLVGAADISLGWLALALVVEGVAITVAGLRLRPPERPVLLLVGAVETAAAWVTFVQWLAWPTDRILLVTAPAAAAIVLAGGLAIRGRRVPMDLAATWALTGALGSLAAMTLIGQPGVDRLAGGLDVAGSLTILAAAVAVTTPVFGNPVRWISVAPTAAALLTTGWAIEMTALQTIYTTSGIGLGAAIMLIGGHALRPSSPWIRPALLLAGVVQATGWLVSSDLLDPGPTPLTVLLLVAAAESAAVAIVLEQPGLHVFTPLFGCGAWLVVAADRFAHEINWFTMPIGVTLLVVIGLVRWIRRTRGGDVTGHDIALSEFVAMAFIVAPPLAQTIVTHLWYSLVAIVAGFLLAGWGVTTRVRGRAAFGAGTVVLAAVLAIGVPLAQAVPTWHGPSLWLALAGFGAAAIVIATLIEQGRSTVRRLSELLDEITRDWEHTGGRPGGMPHPTAHA